MQLATNIIAFPMPTPKHFIPPNIEECLLHAAKVGLPEREAQKFHAFYDSKDWFVGKNKMKRWHSSMALWRLNYLERGGKPLGQPQIKLPTEIDVCKYGAQMGASVDFCRQWHLDMVRKNYRVNGKLVEWQIKFSADFAAQRKEINNENSRM